MATALRPPLPALALLASPAVAIFVSSNLVNVGNLAFNMLFSRWMGPEMFGDLALLLTLKLALLGVIGAVQMAVSQHLAARAATGRTAFLRAMAALDRRGILALAAALPIVVGLLLAAQAGPRLGLGGTHLLVLLLLALPVTLSFSILRGVAFGEMRTGRLVLSANVEMGVRLGGAVLAWQAGMGLEGVVAAVALSIVAGWAALSGLLPERAAAWDEARPVARALVVAALPLALLQAAQVLALDGDIFLAGAALPDDQTGLLAALSLFQRIQFFACFMLASVLMPSVVGAARDGRSILAAAAPVGLIYAAVAVVVTGLSLTAPTVLVALMVGPDFAAAAQGLPLAVVSAAAFTLSYLLATLLAALGDRRGLFAAVGAAALQLTLMALALGNPGTGWLDLLTIKAATQGALALALLLLTLRHLARR
jgi:O-antigen/teichoic acid export membrane protein